jgi:hypothetical protein
MEYPMKSPFGGYICLATCRGFRGIPQTAREKAKGERKKMIATQ